MDFSTLTPIYASLVRNTTRDLMRLKGMSKEDAEVVALQFMLDSARDLMVGVEELEAELDRRGVPRRQSPDADNKSAV